MPVPNPASAYKTQAVQTANGPQLLLMLCDRLAVDIARADVALVANDNKAANDELQHAQRIVRMLRNALQPDGFDGGRSCSRCTSSWRTTWSRPICTRIWPWSGSAPIGAADPRSLDEGRACPRKRKCRLPRGMSTWPRRSAHLAAVRRAAEWGAPPPPGPERPDGSDP